MVTGGGAAPPGTVTEPLSSVIVLSAGRKMAAAAASGPGCSSAAAAVGAGAAGVSEWLVLRDGCLRCDADGLHSLSYHPALNAILAVTSRGTIKVIDGTSGATLQASALSGECAARRAGAAGDAGRGSCPVPGLRPLEGSE
jgi:baculoviral IAP repeat-containing protein 6